VTEREHFVLAGRLIGADEGWVDCVCGWHFSGTVKESREQGEKHLDTYGCPLCGKGNWECDRSDCPNRR